MDDQSFKSISTVTVVHITYVRMYVIVLFLLQFNTKYHYDMHISAYCIVESSSYVSIHDQVGTSDCLLYNIIIAHYNI